MEARKKMYEVQQIIHQPILFGVKNHTVIIDLLFQHLTEALLGMLFPSCFLCYTLCWRFLFKRNKTSSGIFLMGETEIERERERK